VWVKYSKKRWVCVCFYFFIKFWMFKIKNTKKIKCFNFKQPSVSKIQRKSYCIVFPYENSKYMFACIYDLITSLLNSWEFSQYFNKPSFFNSWELMVKNLNIEPLTYKWDWYLKYWSWLKNSQSYSKYSPILIGSIFHRNT
jgi:hypothetical protein